MVLLCSVLVGCSQKNAVLKIHTNLRSLKDCGVLIADKHYQVDAFALYVSELALKINEQWRPVNFITNESQSAETALIDFVANCSEGNVFAKELPIALTNNSFEQAQAIRFMLGVPFKSNHRNPVTLPAPLNQSAMFWSWQRGHKFVRIDVTDDGGEQWRFHLGSVGCQSASALRGPDSPCLKPNLMEFELQVNDSAGAILLDFSNWTEGLVINNSNTCMFNVPQEDSCEVLLDNIQASGFRWLANINGN